MNKELIERNIRLMDDTVRKMKDMKVSLHKFRLRVKELEESNELTRTYLETMIDKFDELFKAIQPAINRCVYDYRDFRVEYETNSRIEVVAEEFFRTERVYEKERLDFKEFQQKYQDYVPRNINHLKKQIREQLEKVGYVIDGAFEGDFSTWIGVYARPKEKPTYLDPMNEEEAKLQEKYSKNGFKQDFTEWFEFEIVDGTVQGV